jgi:autotransporter-associated beta strand protein
VQTIALAANLPVDVPGTLEIPSVLTGTSTLTKSGAGTLVLSGANAFGPAGGTFTLGGGTVNAGALRLAHPQALGRHSKILLASDQGGVSRLELSGGWVFPLNVDTAGRNTAAGSVAVRNLDGANTLQGNITITAIGGGYHIEAVAGSSLTITGNLTTSLNAAGNRDLRFLGDGDLTLQGAVADSATATPTRLAVTKEGRGKLTLAGTSTHQLGTVVKAGTLKLDGTFTSSAVTVDSGATLTGNGALPAATVSGTLLLDASQAPLDFSGTLALNNATLAITGSTADAVRVLATRTAISGSFATITGVPVGYTLDTHYNGNAIALVRKATAGYEIWAAGHALAPAGPGAPGSDPDGDGFANAIEFVLGMDPSRADAGHGNLPRSELVGANLVVTFTRIKAAVGSGFASVAEFADDLEAGWSPVPLERIQVTDHGATETVSVTMPLNSASHGFVRLRVAGPPVLP